MKNTLCSVVLLFVISLTHAQDYQITFSGSGGSTTVDSVQVMNITQETSLTVNGSDILYLQGQVGINEFIDTDNALQIYPNPMRENSRISFYSDRSNKVTIDIFDVSGRLIVNRVQQVQKGISSFEISGLSSGVYSLVVSTKEWKHSAKLIANRTFQEKTHIEFNGTVAVQESQSNQKSTNEIVPMQYNDGDLIKFTGYSSGTYARVVVLIPTEDMNVDFYFVECTDGEGGIYPVVHIGEQDWMAKSLSTTKLNDGTALPNVTDDFEWSSLETPAYCYYENDGGGFGSTYGVLYNWYAVETENLCPEGWRVPSDQDWTILTNFAGGEDYAGGKLKETSYTHWQAPNAYATDEYGFTALPGGYRVYDGSFGFVGTSGFWWTTTEDVSGTVWGRYMSYVAREIYRYSYNKRMGLSVRCIRN